MPSSYLTMQYKDFKKNPKNQNPNTTSPQNKKTPTQTNIKPVFENAITENKQFLCLLAFQFLYRNQVSQLSR